MKEPLSAFKAVHLFSHSKLHEMKPSISAIDSLEFFPFLSAAIPSLKEEFPQYAASVEDIDSSYDPLLFWKQNEQKLPAWSRAARQVLLVQPSSAASEHVLQNCFGESQNSAL